MSCNRGLHGALYCYDKKWTCMLCKRFIDHDKLMALRRKYAEEKSKAEQEGKAMPDVEKVKSALEKPKAPAILIYEEDEDM